MPVPRFNLVADRRAIIDRRALADRLAALGRASARAPRGILRKALAEAARRSPAGWRKSRCGPAAAPRLPPRPDRPPRLRLCHRAALPAPQPDQRERLLLLGLGGYGRGEMAPFSDVDIAFVTPEPTAWTEQVVESILYLLWDLGLKVGHSAARSTS